MLRQEDYQETKTTTIFGAQAPPSCGECGQDPANGHIHCGACSKPLFPNSSVSAEQARLVHGRLFHPKSPSEVWKRTREYLKKWIGLRDVRNYDLLTAFAFASYMQDKFDHAVYLHFLGKKNTGKSRAIKVLQQISCNAFRSVDDTPAGLYRTIQDTFPCTMLLDEFSTYSKDERKEILRILNAGNEFGVTVTRINKDAKAPEDKRERFSTFCFKAFAGIDEMNDTLSSRSYKIITRRISKKYRARQRQIENEGLDVKREIQNWAAGNSLEPFFSQELFENDRVFDLFVPLLTVAPSDEIRATLIELGEEMVQAEDEDEKDTSDAQVFDAIQEIVREKKLADGSTLTILEIQSRLDPVFDVRRIGRITKRLGFKKGRTEKQKFIVISANLVECRNAEPAVSLENAERVDQAQNSRSEQPQITAETSERHFGESLRRSDIHESDDKAKACSARTVAHSAVAYVPLDKSASQPVTESPNLPKTPKPLEETVTPAGDPSHQNRPEAKSRGSTPKGPHSAAAAVKSGNCENHFHSQCGGEKCSCECHVLEFSRFEMMKGGLMLSCRNHPELGRIPEEKWNEHLESEHGQRGTST